MFAANSSKNPQGFCQPTKDSICYNLPQDTHDEDHFHHPQFLKLACGTHTEWILNRNKNTTKLIKSNRKIITKTKYYLPNKFSIHTSYKLKNWNTGFNSKFYNTTRNF